MRYYKMIIGTNSEKLQSSAERIKEKSNIRIGGSGYYSTPMEAVNDYLYRNTENHVTSVVYKEEDGCRCERIEIHDDEEYKTWRQILDENDLQIPDRDTWELMADLIV